MDNHRQEPGHPTSANPQPRGEGVPALDSRRQHSRRLFDHEVLVFEVDRGHVQKPGVSCRARDISRSGIALRCKRMIYAGRCVLVRLELPERGVRVLYGVVRHARYDDAGLYHLGVEFERIPESSEIQMWLRDQNCRSHG